MSTICRNGVVLSWSEALQPEPFHAAGSAFGEQFGPVLGREAFHLLPEFSLLLFVELRWRCGAGGDWDSHFREEALLPGGRADAEQTGWLAGVVVELMGRVRGDVDGLAFVHDGSDAAEGGLDLAGEQDEGFLEVMTVGRGSTAGWDVHVDDAEPAVRVVTRDSDGVGVSYETDVRQLGFGVGTRDGELACKVIWAERRVLRWRVGHGALLQVGFVRQPEERKLCSRWTKHATGRTSEVRTGL